MTIRLIGLSTGAPTEFDGKYLVDYDPTPKLDDDGEYVHLVVTDDASEARQFRTWSEAIDFYHLASQSEPRPDGRPDRPLTAYTVEIA